MIIEEEENFEDKNSAQPSLCQNIYFYGHYIFHFGCTVFVYFISDPMLGKLDNAKWIYRKLVILLNVTVGWGNIGEL